MMRYGSQYFRPPHPKREDWRGDLEHMRALGFNTVKLWAVWNTIEREPGRFDFSDLDELVSLAGEQGLQVVINLIPEGAPYWLEAGQEDAMYTTARGEKVTFTGAENMPTAGWPGLCMDKPEVQRYIERFIQTLTAHYAQNETVAVFDVWNEPHLEPMFAYRSEILCYCEHSVRTFRRWLREKYGTLEELNRQWYRCYTDWEQVKPPVRMSTCTDMMDWRLFWLSNLRRWLRIRVAAAKRGAPDKPVQTHVAYSAIVGNRIQGGLSNEVVDEFQFAREVDIFGTSGFPKWLMGDRHVLYHLMQTEIIAEAAREKPFYQVELQGGGGRNGLLGTEVPTRRDITLWNWNTLAAGGKGVLYWQYRAEPAGLESPGFGLVGLAGEDTERSLAAGACARSLSGPVLERAVRTLPVNGIYLSRTSEVLCYCNERREELYAQSVTGIYEAAYRRRIPVRFVHADYADRLWEEGLRTLYLPMPLSLSEHEVDALLRFVQAGGTLVSEAFPGLYDEGGRLETRNEALRALFGLRHIEVQNSPHSGPIAIYPSDGSPVCHGRMYRQAAAPCAAVETLASFADGLPAVTEYRNGAGRAIWIGSFLSGQYHDTEEAAAGMLLTRWMRPEGYACLEEISCLGPQEASCFQPLVRLLETPEQWVLIALNHTERETCLRVRFRAGETAQGEACHELHLPPSDGRYVLVNRRAACCTDGERGEKSDEEK